MVKLGDKDAQDILDVLVRDYGWRFEPSGRSGHAAGTLKCPHVGRDGCRHSINGTPRTDNVRRLRKIYRNCPHKPAGEESPF